MGMLRNVRDQAAYVLMASTSFPFALEMPSVYFGRFNEHQRKGHQDDLYKFMRSTGWKKEIFQLVLPGQNAGLVKSIKREGSDEAHVRFFEDGVVSCELEGGRWGIAHWQNKRIYGRNFLGNLIQESDLGNEEKEMLTSNIRYRSVPGNFSLRRENKYFDSFCKKASLAVASTIFLGGLAVWEYGVGTYVAVRWIEPVLIKSFF